MTTLCLCDWVETKVDRERRLATNAMASITPRRNTNIAAEEAPAHRRAPHGAQQHTPTPGAPLMIKRLIPIAAVGALMLAGCQETPSDTAKDVAKARQDAAQKADAARQDASKVTAKANDQVADAQQAYAKTDQAARKKLTQAEAEAMTKMATADFDLAMTEASGRNKVAQEKCDALTGVDKDACRSTADAALAADKATITAKRDALLVQAEHHD